jgi:hypothetical protein
MLHPILDRLGGPVRSEQILAQRIMRLRPDIAFKQNAKEWWHGGRIWVIPNRVEGRVRVSVRVPFDDIPGDTLATLKRGLGDVRPEATAKRHLSFLVIDGTDMNIVGIAMHLV